MYLGAFDEGKDEGLCLDVGQGPLGWGREV